MLFCCKIGFLAIYALLSQICFVAIYALLCGEKLTKNCVCGEKMTNIRYAIIRQKGPVLEVEGANLATAFAKTALRIGNIYLPSHHPSFNWASLKHEDTNFAF